MKKKKLNEKCMYYAKSIFYTLVVLLLLGFLQKPFLEHVVLNPFDRITYSVKWIDIVFMIVVFIITCIIVWKIYYIKVFQHKYYSYGLTVLLLYALYRSECIPHTDWVYVPIKVCPDFFYIDIPAMTIGLILIFHPIKIGFPYIAKSALWQVAKTSVISCKTKVKNYTHCLKKPKAAAKVDSHHTMSDDSITLPKEDKYNFYPKVEYLVEQVLDKKSQFERSAHSIGIIGGWGSGKSSFLNLTKYYIEKEKKAIVVEFNPWYSQSKEQIMIDFLATLRDRLVKFDPQIGRPIEQYAQTLAQAVDFSSVLLKLFHWSQEKSLKHHFDQVNVCIAKFPVPIIIFIDDLDRLLADEIMNVFQLIRNTANFKNTIFFVAYDKSYVINTMEKGDIIKPEEYLEKIINVPINLPYVDPQIKMNVMTELLENLLIFELNDNEKKTLRTIIKSNYTDTTLRKVKQLANNINTTCLELVREKTLLVNTSDFLRLMYIEMTSDPLYKAICSKDEQLFDRKSLLIESTIKLNTSELSKHRKHEEREKGKIDFIHKFDPSITEASATILYDMLDYLFGSKYDSGSINDNLRIRKRILFNCYIEKRFDGIDKIEFREARDKGATYLCSKLKEWDENKRRTDEIIDYIKEIEFTDRTDADELIDKIADICLYFNMWSFPIPGIVSLEHETDKSIKQIYFDSYIDYICTIEGNERMLKKKFIFFRSMNNAKLISEMLKIAKPKNRDLTNPDKIYSAYIDKYLSLKPNTIFYLLIRPLNELGMPSDLINQTREKVKVYLKSNFERLIDNRPTDNSDDYMSMIEQLFMGPNKDSKSTEWMSNYRLFINELSSDSTETKKKYEEHKERFESYCKQIEQNPSE